MLLLAAGVILVPWVAVFAEPAAVGDPPSPAAPTAVAPTPGAPAEVSITGRGTVRMHVADVPLSTVLHLLSLEGQRNIVTSPNVKGAVTANLYDVSFGEALGAILAQNGAGYLITDGLVYVHTLDELAEIEAANAPPPIMKVYRLNYLAPADAQSYISPLLADDETIALPPAPATGLKSDTEDGGGFANAAQEFIIVIARSAAHEQIESLIEQIDVCPPQVLIEATILRASLTDDNALGIDFTLVGGVDLELLGASSRGIADIRLGNLPQDRFEKTNAVASTGFSTDVQGNALTVGIIKDNVAIFLRALEQVTDTVVLANPKVLALNKHKGQIIVGRRDGYMTTTITETQAIQTVEFLETGTQLVFRPFVGNDGFIRVELHPEDSVGFVNADGLPSEQTTEVTTNVIVRDGETILIGGLFREVTTDSRNQVPGLGDIPGLGAMFRSKSNSTIREEVIILLTINIVKNRDAYSELSREQLENIERMRIGARQGLMWHGRERIAQAQYRKALDAISDGDNDKALWHLNMTLHNNCRFLPAIRLKETILSERAWEEDGTGGRMFLHRLISRQRGYDLQPFARPAPPTIQRHELPDSHNTNESENET